VSYKRDYRADSISVALKTHPPRLPTVYTQVEPILPSPPILREGFAYKQAGTEPRPLKVPLFKGDLGGSERGLGLIQRSVYSIGLACGGIANANECLDALNLSLDNSD
jgi:hypothetical protein